VNPALRLVRACAHCGLAVPAGRDGAYCCAGCEVVHDAIARHGLERFYQLRETAAPAHTTSASYAELDDPAFERVHVRRDEAGRASVALFLEDLRCGACAWLIEATPRCVPGVVDVRVDLGRGRADVVWDPAATALSAIAQHLDRIGHIPHAYRGVDREQHRRREDRALLVKLGVAGAATGNLMLLAIALYAGLFGGMSADDTALFRWASMLVAVPALGYAASPMFRTALAALRVRRLHLDLPISIGIVVGLTWGSANVVRGTGEIYFDSLAMLVFLLLVSRWIVLRYQRRASSAAELLLALVPRRARRVTGDRVDDVPIEAVKPGDLLEVRTGEKLPVDGVIARGRSTIDGGLLTGESRPIEVGPGERVHAGTLNLTAPIAITAAAVGEHTRVGALVASIEALSARRAPIERHVDRIAGRFVAIVTAGAALTGLGWALRSPGLGLEHAMALLVVTCPCALALATPLAVAVALGRAARRDILIKGADALERIATPGTMFVDKTGTLTAGRLAVASWHGDVDARALAAAIERGSAHPIARAIVEHVADERGLDTRDLHEELGRGVRGRVAGRSVAVGAPAWVRTLAAFDPRAEAWIADVVRRSETPVAIAVDGTVVAIAGLADPIRPDSAGALATLAAHGWTVRILSGDDARVVARVGDALGLAAERCTGEVTPEGKRRAVEAARRRGPVAMVGDGANDAAAMASATCGIAVSGAAELAIEAADVYLRSASLAAVAELVGSARATLATIRRSLRFSVAYNLLAGTLAITGVIHPLIAAVLMPASSLTVLATALRSKAFTRRSSP